MQSVTAGGTAVATELSFWFRKVKNLAILYVMGLEQDKAYSAVGIFPAACLMTYCTCTMTIYKPRTNIPLMVFYLRLLIYNGGVVLAR